jgi:hypothetical protein
MVKSISTWHSRLNLQWDAIKGPTDISRSFSNRTMADLISSRIQRFKVCADLVSSLSSINSYSIERECYFLFVAQME